MRKHWLGPDPMPMRPAQGWEQCTKSLPFLRTRRQPSTGFFIPSKGRDMQLVPTSYDSRGRARSLKRVDTPAPVRPQVIDVAPIQAPVQRVERLRSQTTGSHTDRAIGFSIATWQISIITALALVVVLRFWHAYPLFSFTAAGVFFGAFLFTWGGAFLLHTFVSAEGIELLDTWLMWRYIRAEQKERHRRYRGQ